MKTKAFRPATGPQLTVRTSSVPIGEDDPTLNAYLGVSLSKTHFFDKPMMHRYLSWALDHYEKLLVIVADHLEAYNKQALRGMKLLDAEASALRTGRQYQIGFRRAIPVGSDHRVEVKLASELIADPECRRIIEQVHAAAARDREFLQTIRDTSEKALLHKLGPLQRRKGETPEGKLDILQNYLIEEIGIILHICCRSQPRYQVSIFNYPPPSILDEVFSGRFCHHFAELTGRQPYLALELVPSSSLSGTGESPLLES